MSDRTDLPDCHPTAFEPGAPPSAAGPKGALIVTVGGSPQPIARTIERHRPAYICWICSQKSVEQVRDVVAAVGFDAEFPRPADRKELVEDEDEIVNCYVTATRAVGHVLREKGIDRDGVVADITGGTKPMAAALALAAVTENIHISYVGGTLRTKDGVGQVIDGAEVVRVGDSPWKLLAVDELRRMASRFNRYQFDAVVEVASSVVARPGVGADLRRFAEIVSDLAAAYAEWDRFSHKSAVEKLKSVVTAAEAPIALGHFSKHVSFFAAVRGNLEWLQRIQEASHGFEQLLIEELFVDLVANARRRASEGKYDDAVARLYRAVELLAQISLRRRGIESTGKVSPERIPESIRDEYVSRYSGCDGMLQLPLYASFGLLQAFGDDIGVRFADQREEIEKVISARNRSILAHGTSPVGEVSFGSLLAKVLALHGADADVPFPTLAL